MIGEVLITAVLVYMWVQTAKNMHNLADTLGLPLWVLDVLLVLSVVIILRGVWLM